MQDKSKQRSETDSPAEDAESGKKDGIHLPAATVGAASAGALGLGAVTLGAVAVGAFAVGGLVIGGLALRRKRRRKAAESENG